MIPRLALLGLLLLLALPGRAVEPFVATDDFLTYMKTVLNPAQLGVREGRFYPYLTPAGRRIGYGHSVEDKSLYQKGWLQEDADRHLRDDIAAAARELAIFLAHDHPGHSLDQLDDKSRQILLDFAVTEGAEKIRPEVYRAVLDHDWDKLINGYLYVRGPEGWPNQLENHAFAQRWIYGPDPLVPLSPKAKASEEP